MRYTTEPKIRKNTILRTVLILIISTLCILLIVNTFSPFKGKFSPPNQELIKSLERDRQEILKGNQEIKDLISSSNQAAADRQHADSTTDLLTQQRLTQALTELKHQHEKNTYIFNLSAVELRRAYHDFNP